MRHVIHARHASRPLARIVEGCIEEAVPEFVVSIERGRRSAGEERGDDAAVEDA